MGVTIAHRRFTVDEYHRMAETGILGPQDRVELIEGEIVEMSPIGEKHAVSVDGLTAVFVVKTVGRATVRVQGPIRLDRRAEPQPDLAILHPNKERYSTDHPGPGDIFLVIEVSDTTQEFDRETKIPAYARAGIRESWLVNLVAGNVEVFRRPGLSGYGDVRIFGRGQTVAPEAFPDVVIKVDEILG